MFKSVRRPRNFSNMTLICNGLLHDIIILATGRHGRRGRVRSRNYIDDGMMTLTIRDDPPAILDDVDLALERKLGACVRI